MVFLQRNRWYVVGKKHRLVVIKHHVNGLIIDMFSTFVLQCGFQHSSLEYSVFTHHSSSGIIVLIDYVDCLTISVSDCWYCWLEDTVE